MKRRAFVQVSGLYVLGLMTSGALTTGCSTGEAPSPSPPLPDNAPPRGPLAPLLSTGEGARAFAGDGTSAGLAPLEHRVELFDPSGAVIARLGDPDRAGSGEVGTLNAPVVALWGEGARLFVLEAGNARLQAFSSSGRALGVVATTSRRPSDVALAPSGLFYAAVPSAHRIEVFDASGRAVRTLGRFGIGADGLNGPRSVAVAADGAIHLVDSGGGRVKVLSAEGRSIGSYGDGLLGPTAIRFDHEGRAWVADALGAKLRVYDRTGVLLDTISPRLPDGRPGAPIALTARADGTMYAALAAAG